MKCSVTRALIVPWLDSELDARTLVEVEGHLNACAACRRRFTAEAQIEASFAASLRERSWAEDETAVEAEDAAAADRDAKWQRWLAELPALPSLPRRRPWRAIAAAAAALLIAGTWLTWSRPQPVALVAELRARFEAAVAGTQRPELASARADVLQAFFVARGLPEFRALPPGQHGDHVLGLVGASDLRIGNLQGVELLMNCCGRPATVYVLPRSACELLCAQAAAEVAAGGTSQVTVDGITATMFLDHDLLVSVVSEHPMPVDGWRAS